MEMLNINDPEFAKKFAAALGVDDLSECEFVTPQFHRTDGVIPSAPPQSLEEWLELTTLPKERLRQKGLGIWDDENGLHWLYPGKWYNYIPEGLPVISINGDVEIFHKGETDDDIRFGCLAYVFIQKERI